MSNRTSCCRCCGSYISGELDSVMQLVGGLVLSDEDKFMLARKRIINEDTI